MHTLVDRYMGVRIVEHNPMFIEVVLPLFPPFLSLYLCSHVSLFCAPTCMLSLSPPLEDTLAVHTFPTVCFFCEKKN